MSTTTVILDTRTIDPTQQTHARVRIKNFNNGKYLSLQDEETNWKKDGCQLALKVRDDDSNGLESPQVWHLIKWREDEWILLNQYNTHLASIQGRTKDNGGCAIIHHSEILWASEHFQQWTFIRYKDTNSWLIKNKNSGKCLGPENRSDENNHGCTQWDDQSKESDFQAWEFEELL